MSTVPFNDLRRQAVGLPDAIDTAIRRVLDRGWFILGEELRCFEQEFAAYCGAAYAVGVASGTEALYIALKAIGVEPEDEVITVANTCVPTVAGIAMTGAKPVLVDVDHVSRTMSPDGLARAVTPRTKAIVPDYCVTMVSGSEIVRKVRGSIVDWMNCKLPCSGRNCRT